MAHMTQQEREKQTSFFKNAAGDGSLTALELKRHLDDLGAEFTFKDVVGFYKALDLNNDKEVTLDEFLEALDSTEVQRERLTKLFYELDSSNDGKVTRAELQSGLSNLQANGIQIDEAHAQELLESADEDGDGKISVEEFVKAIFGC